METQDVLRLFDADFVIPEILDVFDAEIDAQAQLLLNRRFNQVAHFSNGVVTGGDVEDAGDFVIRLDGTNVRRGRVLDAQNRPPDRGIVDGDGAVLHGALEHSVD